MANIYDNKLKNYVIVPSIFSDHFHSYHLYVIKTQKRNKLFAELKKKNVDVRIHYPIPVHKQKIYFSQNQMIHILNGNLKSKFEWFWKTTKWL